LFNGSYVVPIRVRRVPEELKKENFVNLMSRGLSPRKSLFCASPREKKHTKLPQRRNTHLRTPCRSKRFLNTSGMTQSPSQLKVEFSNAVSEKLGGKTEE